MNILLADDQTKVRFALRILLEQQPDLKVIGEARNAIELIQQTECLPADIVLLDAHLPGLDFENFIRSVRRSSPGVRVIALIEEQLLFPGNPAHLADAYASKSNPPEHLLSVIRDFQLRS
jgi:DNA-binding NarL/FixJ family response regulator